MTRKYWHHSALANHLTATALPITRTEARSTCGVRALDRCVAEGTVVRVLPGVYVSAESATDRVARMRAALAWTGGRGALTGPAALWAYECMDRPPDVVTLLVPPAFKRAAPPWIRLLRTHVSPRILRVKRMRVVVLAHAVVEAWNQSSGDEAIGIVVGAVAKAPVTSAGIAAAVVATPRVRRRRELLALLDVLDGGVTSFLEHRARTRVFAASEFKHLRWQMRVVAQGRVRYLDAYDEEAHLALEFDGAAFHSGEAALQRDSTRDAQLATLDIMVLRFTFGDLMDRPQWCRDTYREVREARLRGARRRS